MRHKNENLPVTKDSSEGCSILDRKTMVLVKKNLKCRKKKKRQENIPVSLWIISNRHWHKIMIMSNL